jgi:hypothetical protein
MRPFAVLGALWFLAATSLATAQLQVSAQTARTNFLLYERVDLIVTITNIGETDILLDNNEGQPWLSFVLTHRQEKNDIPVQPERDSNFAALTVKAGETKTLRVNLTPLFSFREEGDYRAAVVIDLPGQGQIMSDSVPFTVLNGHKVWSQTRSVDGTMRDYSLVRFSPDANSTNIYLRVESPSENLVYTNISLGEVISSVDPEVFFDPAGNLHILNPFAMGTYLYTRADPSGKIVHQGIFKTFNQIPPRLYKLADGNVIVGGGLEEDPNAPREKLSTGQVAGRSPSPTDPPVGEAAQ